MDRRCFLSSVGATLATPALTLASSIPGLAAAATEISVTMPNVIIMICDDLGYGDLGCYGSKINTPHLNRMAAEGVRFTRYNSAHPICSASRAALLTGRYGTRSGVPDAFSPLEKGGMNLDEITLANVLKERGYRTMCIGKWHLGHTEPYLPTNRGFDEFFGVPYSVDMTPLPLTHNTTVIEEDTDRDLLTPRYTKQAVKFIRRAKRRPFFLYVAFSFPHIPLNVSSRFRGKSRLGIYGDAVEEIDWSVGKILETLKENNLDRNTLVVFTSDHGPWYQGSAGHLRGRKMTNYEGGVRVPFIARWTGRIPAGRVSNAWISELDVLPTIASLCQAHLPPRPLDGVNVTDLLTCRKDNIERPALLYFFRYDLQCARQMNWKLWFANYNRDYYNPGVERHNYFLYRPELYNLDDDPAESYCVAYRNPAIVASIMNQVESMMHTFPQHVQDMYRETKSRVGSAFTPIAAYPMPRGYKRPAWVYISKHDFKQQP